MNEQSTPAVQVPAGDARRLPAPLLRHYLEMLAAMTIGMLALGPIRESVGLSASSAESPGLWYLLMATDMALAMTLWMQVRRHAWRSTLEMCMAMYVPLALLPLVWLSVLSAMVFMVAAHVLMAVAMIAVLLWRRSEFVH